MQLTGIIKSFANTPLANFGWRSFTESIIHFATLGSFRLHTFIPGAMKFKQEENL